MRKLFPLNCLLPPNQHPLQEIGAPTKHIFSTIILIMHMLMPLFSFKKNVSKSLSGSGQIRTSKNSEAIKCIAVGGGHLNLSRFLWLKGSGLHVLS